MKTRTFRFFERSGLAFSPCRPARLALAHDGYFHGPATTADRTSLSVPSRRHRAAPGVRSSPRRVYRPAPVYYAPAPVYYGRPRHRCTTRIPGARSAARSPVQR